MANTNDSFIDEVSEAVRRERLNLWFRRWGWLILLVVVAIVGAVSWNEWRQARARAAAEFRGEAILAALTLPDQPERAAALSELPREGAENVVAALLVAVEQMQAGDPEGAAGTLQAIADDPSVPPLYRDLAALRAQMALGEGADRATLDALAQPGAPFSLLAMEQLAILDLAGDRRDEAVATLQAIREDAGVSPAQRGRVENLLVALGVPPEAEPPAETLPAGGE